MRVVLVYSNRNRILEPTPPIGLSYIASATRSAGHEVRFVDMMISRNPDGDLRRALTEYTPDVVGISVRNIDNEVPQRLFCHLGAFNHFHFGMALREVQSDLRRRFRAFR